MKGFITNKNGLISLLRREFRKLNLAAAYPCERSIENYLLLVGNALKDNKTIPKLSHTSYGVERCYTLEVRVTNSEKSFVYITVCTIDERVVPLGRKSSLLTRNFLAHKECFV